MAKKSDIAVGLSKKFNEIKKHGYHIKFFRCDNAGENRGQVKELANEVRIHMEQIALHTLEHNGVVERRIAVLKDLS